ncbi:MAG: energy-coupling factor transporter transmembrane component T family protein [Thermodesulfovibrionales bacterium]
MLPEIKIVLYVIFVVSLYLITNLSVYLWILIPLLLLLLRVPWRTVRAGWLPITLFLAFTFLSHTLNQHGRVLFSLGPVMLTDEGLHTGLFKVLRIFLLIAGIKILMAGEKTEALIQAMGRLFGPLEKTGIPVKDFIHTMGLTLQCFPLLNAMAADIYRTEVRQAEVKGFMARIKTVSSFLIPLFTKSLQTPEMFFKDIEGHGKQG